MDPVNYWKIFWRTFAQLALAVLLVIQVPDLVDSTWIRNTAEATGLGLAASLLGAVVAVLWAYIGTPAATALGKAFRSAAQALAGTLGGLVLTQTSDLLTVPKVIVGGLISIVLAFAITYFQNQGPVPPPAATS